MSKKIKDGPFKKYYKNGQLEFETTIKNGKKHGPWKWYYEDGDLMEEGTYRNDEKDGLSRFYHDTGKISEKTYKNGSVIHSNEPQLNNHLHGKLCDYIYEEKIYKRNIFMGTTLTLYKSEMYKVFSDYSKDDIDYCLEIFEYTFNLGDDTIYPIHGRIKVKKVKIEDKKGWF